MQISHIENIPLNTQKLIDDGKLDKRDTQVQLMLAGNKRLRMRTLEKKLKDTGITVAELMLSESVETEWYKEASVDYIGQNLMMLRKEWGFSTKVMANLTGISATACASYEQGILPTTGKLQALADVLEVEVADLMLPPDGSEESETN